MFYYLELNSVFVLNSTGQAYILDIRKSFIVLVSYCKIIFKEFLLPFLLQLVSLHFQAKRFRITNSGHGEFSMKPLNNSKLFTKRKKKNYTFKIKKIHVYNSLTSWAFVHFFFLKIRMSNTGLWKFTYL